MSSTRCLVFFGNFTDKCLQLSLHLTLRLQFIFKYLKSQNKCVIANIFNKITQELHAFFIKALQNCYHQSFEGYSTSVKICLHIMEKFQTLNHLLEDVLSKSKYLSSVKQLILQDYFPRGGSRNPAKYKMEHFVTRLESLQTLEHTKSSIFNMAGVGTTSGYKSKWKQISLNYELLPMKLLFGSEQIYLED